MEFNEENLHQVMNVMERGQEEFENLREQRDRLFEANKRLVKLVKELEGALEEAEGGTIRYEESEYSFKDGWMPTDIIHDKSLDLSEDIDLDEIDEQVDEVIKSMKSLENLKKES
jgi:hypothetical protein